jgi:uncharacterized sulfatase
VVDVRLGDRGYRTACLSRNSYVSSGTGLDRGFDRFAWISSSSLLSAVPKTTLLKWALNIRRHSAGFTLDPAKHATPFLLNDMATRWLDEFAAGDDPFFLYCHYNEPHRPYYPPLPYLETYTDEIDATAEEAVDIAMRVHRDAVRIMAEGCDLSDRELDAMRAMYDAEIRYTDEMVGRLFEHVQSLSRDVVFVVTADHGELFCEHGLLAHRLVLTDPVTHVPLVVHAPEGTGLDLSARREDVVQHVDLSTTIVDRAGGSTETCQGVDLRETAREGATSQRPPTDFDQYLEHNADFDVSRFHAGWLTSYRTHDHRFQHGDGRTELFVPPDEETDVSDAHPDVAADLEARVVEWLETEGQTVTGGEESGLTDEMRRQLRDLGYLE